MEGLGTVKNGIQGIGFGCVGWGVNREKWDSGQRVWGCSPAELLRTVEGVVYCFRVIGLYFVR